MFLVISCFVTHQRNPGPNDLGKRYNRFDIFKYVLKTYEKINFEHIYLYIGLDTEFLHRKDEFEEFVYNIFGKDKVSLEFRRLLEQHEWIPLMNTLKESGEDKLIFFMQCDDYPLIDFNVDLLHEGIKLLENDNSHYKMLGLGHWPECVSAAYVHNNYKKVNNYINTRWTITDPLNIYNLRFLYDIFINLKWQHTPGYGRIDTILGGSGAPWARPHHPLGPHMDNLLSVWVPLRELCRHFDGYPCDYGLDGAFPVLHLPPDLLNIAPFTFTKQELIDRFLMRENYFQKSHGPFKLPKEWEDTMLELYKPVTIEK